MLELRTVIKTYERLSYSGLLDSAYSATIRASSILKRLPKDSAAIYYVSVFISAIGADGYVSVKEIVFFCEIVRRLLVSLGQDTAILDTMVRLVKSTGDDKSTVSDIVSGAGEASAILGANQKDFEMILSLLGEKGEYLANLVYDTATLEERSALLTMILCVFAVDEGVNHAETKFLKRLIN